MYLKLSHMVQEVVRLGNLGFCQCRQAHGSLEDDLGMGLWGHGSSCPARHHEPEDFCKLFNLGLGPDEEERAID